MVPAIWRVVWFATGPDVYGRQFQDFGNRRDAMHFAADNDGEVIYFPSMDEEDWEE